MTENAVVIDDLTIDFKRVRALDSLRIEVPSGSVFGFLGPNGAGKTTTIRVLLGLLEPTAGRASVLGFDTQKEAGEIRRRSGALLEHAGLYERLSAEDNLEFFARAWRVEGAERKARIRELLSSLDLWERRGETVQTWSKGMKQKLAVARTLLHRPELIFLDEPTSGLDPVAAAALRDDLAGLAAREGVTVFLTTHNLDEAEKLCSRVGVIRKGKLLAVGHPDELRAARGGGRVDVVGRGFTEEVAKLLAERPEVVSAMMKNGRLRVDLDGEASFAPLVNLLVEAGVEVEEIRRGNASLEEAFLNLMEEKE